MAFNELITEQKKIYSSTNFVRMIKLPFRKQRIERWTNKNRSVSVTNDRALRSSTTLRTSSRPNRSEISLLQADRRLNVQLYQLGKQREKFIEKTNYEQKLFATKQFLHHKDNQIIHDTYNFVQKCCEYADLYDNDRSGKISEGNSNTKIRHSQSIAPIIDASPTATALMEMSHDKETDDDNLHVQYRINTKNYSQSAHVSNTPHNKISNRNVNSVNQFRSFEICTTNSPSPLLIADQINKPFTSSLKTKYLNRNTFITKSCLEKFHRHPENFLSKSNRYLPLLHHQTLNIDTHENQIKPTVEHSKLSPSVSRLSEESSLTDDEQLSSSEESDTKNSMTDFHLTTTINHDQKNINEIHPINRKDFMDTMIGENQERKLALCHLREREYSRLQTIIRSNRIEHILTPFSSIKTINNNRKQSMHKDEFSNSSLSLHRTKSIDKYKRKLTNTDKNLFELNVLIC